MESGEGLNEVGVMDGDGQGRDEGLGGGMF